MADHLGQLLDIGRKTRFTAPTGQLRHCHHPSAAHRISSLPSSQASGPRSFDSVVIGGFRGATRQLHEVFQRKAEKNSSDLIDWIATGATHEDTISRLHGTICERLAAKGVPLGGSLLAFEAFHPVIAGRVTRWIEGQPVELTSYEAGAPEWTIV